MNARRTTVVVWVTVAIALSSLLRCAAAEHSPGEVGKRAGSVGPVEMVVHATVELSDGSRLVGIPVKKMLRVNMEFTKADVPLAKIGKCELRHKDERIVLTLVNGDRLTGFLEAAEFPVETILGTLTPQFAQIDRMTFSVQQKGALPAGEGTINFGGVNWMAWRTMFEVQGDKLVSLPKARPGFNYGHNGNGRGPLLFTNIGSADWNNYSVEFEYCMTGVDGSFNPYGLPMDFKGGAIFVHVADAKESWNERGMSAYSLSVAGNGDWHLSCAYNDHCAQTVGFGNHRSEGNRKLAEGHGLKLNPKAGNKFRIDVSGTRIQIWVDGEKIADVRDEKMGESFGNTTLDHGGIGFTWGFDSMGWIRNLSTRKL